MMLFKQGFLAGLMIIATAFPAFAQWSEQSREIGARDHPKIVERFGGAMRDEALSAYVDEIGQKMAQYSSQPDAGWTFTVLDSAKVNAFALPAGYVYVTRGLLALAHNEAELAAVLAHEITHVVEEHVEKRQDANSDAVIDGAVGALIGSIFGSGTVDEAIRENMENVFSVIGAYSQEQEFAADEGGIALLKLSGYDPMAQVTFLQAMADNAALLALIAGREYDPENVPFFANHPAPADRLERAAEIAGDDDGALNKDPYLAQLDGLLYGESTQQGFMRDGRFVHPVLGFSFELAPGLRLQNAARQINITGPQGATLVLSGDRAQSGSLQDYVQTWVRQIPRRQRIGRRISDQHAFEINGLDAASATIKFRRGARRGSLELTVIELDNRLYRFAGFTPDRATHVGTLFEQTIRSFHVLDAEDANLYRDTIMTVRRVQTQDTLETLLVEFPDQAYARDRFALLNGLARDVMPQMGSLIKLLGVQTPG